VSGIRENGSVGQLIFKADSEALILRESEEQSSGIKMLFHQASAAHGYNTRHTHQLQVELVVVREVNSV
jgi:hypothetical protein